MKSDLRRRSAHGAAYILIISLSLLLSVMALGATLSVRIAHRASANAIDWDEAGVLAFSAVEDALSTLNARAAAGPATWRTGLVAKAVQFQQAVGRGTLSWELTDDVGGSLSANYMDPIRIYGIGRVGSAVRVYSLQVMPTGAPLDVLRTAVHADTQLTLGGVTTLVGGPASTSNNINLSGTINGSVEALSKSGGGTPTGTSTVPAAAKTMPLADVYNFYLSKAVTIPTSAFADADNIKIENCLLSPTSNPFGATSVDGVYAISALKALTIDNCRICGTLVITGSNKATVTITGPNLWEPNRPDYPSLVVTGTKTVVTLSGSTTWLSEATNSVNYDPPATPYQGTSNVTLVDDYPPQFRGLFDVIDSTGTVNIAGNAYIAGTVITDGTIKTSGQSTFVNDQTLYAKPPLGYSVGNAITPILGSWKWDSLP